jgi:hypothetical protein
VGVVPKKEPQPWSESDRAKLDELLRERDHLEWLQERRARQWGGVKAGAQWIGAVAVVLGLFKEWAVASWHLLVRWLTGQP